MDRKTGIKYIILPFIVTTLVASRVIYGVMNSTDTPNNILRKKKTTVTIASPYQFPNETDFFRGYFGLYSWKEAISAGLYRMVNSIDRDYEPDLALDYPVIDLDKTMITIELKSGLVFSNGEPLTSHDVIFSYQLALRGEVLSRDFGLYDVYLNYYNMQIIDNNTISFRLDQPYAFYMDLFTLPIISRSILIDRFNENNFDWFNYTDFILAGPYKYNSSDLESISLVKNPSYWDGKNIVIEEIIFRHFSSLDQVVLEIQNNTIDIISPLFLVTGNDIQNSTDLVFNNIARTSHVELSLNHKSPYWGTGISLPGNEDATDSDRLIDALKIRRGFSHIIDRSFATFDLLNGHGVPALTAISPSTFGYQTTIEPDDFSIDLTKSFFEDVGYDYSDLGEPDSDGNYNKFFFNLTLMSPNTGSYAWVYQFEQDLPKIGVGVNHHLSTGWSEIIPRSMGSQGAPLLFDEGGFDTLALSIGWDRHFSSGSIYNSDAFIPNGGNFYNFQNSTLDNIVVEYISKFNCGERFIRLETLKKSLYDNLPVIPILHNSNIWIWRDSITGIDPLLINYGAVDWSESRNTEYAAFGDYLSDYLWFLIAPLLGAIITWIIFNKKYKVYEVLDTIEAYPERPKNE